MVCEKCGTQAETKYCPECGAPLEVTAQVKEVVSIGNPEPIFELQMMEEMHQRHARFAEQVEKKIMEQMAQVANKTNYTSSNVNVVTVDIQNGPNNSVNMTSVNIQDGPGNGTSESNVNVTNVSIKETKTYDNGTVWQEDDVKA